MRTLCMNFMSNECLGTIFVVFFLLVVAGCFLPQSSLHVCDENGAQCLYCFCFNDITFTLMIIWQGSVDVTNTFFCPEVFFFHQSR